jgi:hypothetical protein
MKKNVNRVKGELFTGPGTARPSSKPVKPQKEEIDEDDDPLFEEDEAFEEIEEFDEDEYEVNDQMSKTNIEDILAYMQCSL